MGLVRDRKIIQRRGIKLSEKHGLVGFKCSTGYLNKMGLRNGLSLRRRTTTRQQTVFCYLLNWEPWMKGIRALATEHGIIANGYIKGNSVFKLDEFAILRKAMTKLKDMGRSVKTYIQGILGKI